MSAGVPKDRLLSTVNSIAEEFAALEERARPSLPPEGEDVVYDALPDGLIDLPSASRKYGVNRVTLWRWADKGAIKTYGRLKASATGGGYLVLDESEVCNYIRAPRDKGGRPKKSM